MAVITTDILLEGVPRDRVFEWLSDPAHHRVLVEGAFDGFKENGTGDFTVTLKLSPKSRDMGYRFLRPDDAHGGRRVLIETTGKRTKGAMSYSLRTMKPSTNTLVTLHLDYDAGGLLGELVNRAGLTAGIEAGMKKVLENLARSYPRT